MALYLNNHYHTSMTFFSFILTLVNAIAADGPLYLISSDSNAFHFETGYYSMDQCTRWGVEQTRHHSFALKFQLTGKCENGMLICYPGSLDPNGGANSAFGMGPKIQFQVPNHPQSKLGKQCEENHKKCKQQADENHCYAKRVWHGIQVNSTTSNDGILLELSIGQQTYTLNDTRLFNIEFGNPHNIKTKISDQNGQQIVFPQDDKIREAYFSRKVDVPLSKYASLWMLGLDFLPMHNRDTLQLHVYRDCGCEMHAWFVHPSDEMPPVRSDEPEVAANCPAKIVSASAERFTLPTRMNRDKSIRLRQRLNKKPGELVLRFGNEQHQQVLEMHVQQPPYGQIYVQSKQDGVLHDQYVKSASKNDDTMARPRSFKSMGYDDDNDDKNETSVDKYLDVQVVARQYFYEVKVGDRKVFNYFPQSDNWWTKKKVGDISQVEIVGDVYPNSVDVPKVDEMPKQKNQSAKNLYISRFERAIGERDTIEIKGQTGENANPQDGVSLFFGLMHNTPRFNEHVSTLALYLNQEYGDLAIGYFNPKDSYVTKKNDLKLFKSDEPFEMTIEFGSVQNTTNDGGGHTGLSVVPFVMVKITVNTSSQTSQTLYKMNENDFQDINFITIEGNLEIFALPSLTGENLDFNQKKSWEIFPLLAVGDSIVFEAKLNPNATYLKIDLLNPYVGDLAMRVLFNFTGNGTIFMYTWIHQLSDLPEKAEENFNSKLFPGEAFKIKIHVEFEMYKIYTHGALTANFTHVLPPWSVNFVNIKGDFEYFTQLAVDRTEGVFDPNRTLDTPFVIEVPDQKLFQLNDSITVSGQVAQKQNATITILLLNSAIETYESVPVSVQEFRTFHNLTRVGTIICRADFVKTSDGKGYVNFSHLMLDRASGGEESYKLEPAALNPAQKFNLKIIFAERFRFELDGYETFVYNGTDLPAWAIQYIRIEGDLLLSKEPQLKFDTEKKLH